METVVEIKVDDSGEIKAKLDLCKFEDATNTTGEAEETLARVLSKFLKHLEKDCCYDPETILKLTQSYYDDDENVDDDDGDDDDEGDDDEGDDDEDDDDNKEDDDEEDDVDKAIQNLNGRLSYKS